MTPSHIYISEENIKSEKAPWCFIQTPLGHIQPNPLTSLVKKWRLHGQGRPGLITHRTKGKRRMELIYPIWPGYPMASFGQAASFHWQDICGLLMAYCSQYVLLKKGHQDEPLPSADRLPAGRQGWDTVLLAPFLHFPEQICSLECARRKEGHTQKDSAQRFLSGVCRRDLGMPRWLPALQRPRFNSPGQERHGIDCVCIPFYR